MGQVTRCAVAPAVLLAAIIGALSWRHALMYSCHVRERYRTALRHAERRFAAGHVSESYSQRAAIRIWCSRRAGLSLSDTSASNSPA